MNIKIDAIKYADVKKLTGEQWLQARKNGLGGSDGATAAGLSSYSSRLELYLDKTDPDYTEEDKPPQLKEAAEMGHIMEPVIRQTFKAKNPHLKVYQSHFMWQSKHYPFMLANVDGLIYDPERGWGVLECKNMSEYRKNEFGEEEIPLSHLIQAQHYLSVLNLEFCIFAVFIGGNKYREFFVYRDEELIENLIKIEQNFWEEHVLKRIAPEPDGSESSKKSLLKLFPAADAKKKADVVTLSRDAKELADAYEFYSEQEKEMKAKKNKVMQDLQEKIGAYQTAEIEGDDRTIHWTVKKGFDEELLKRKRPEIYSKFTKPALDKTKFKNAYPQLYKEFSVETQTRAFSFTKPKTKKGKKAV